MKFHEAMGRAMADMGIELTFGLMGDANLFIVDSYVRHGGGTFVAACHEASAVMMAHGYASTSGKLGVVSVTHGPGLANTITPLFDAVKSRAPLLILAGDTAPMDKENLQNLPQRELVLATGAGFEEARSPETAIADMMSAAHRAQTERRPVVLNLPKNFQWEDCAYVRPTPLHAERPNSTADREALERAVDVIASVKRPVVLAGRGASSKSARAALIALAARLGAPLATTLKAKDLFKGEHFGLGIFGGLSVPPSYSTIMESDCVIAFGASLNHLTGDGGELFKGKQIVQCDAYPEMIGRNRPVTAGIVGDAAAVAHAIVGMLDERGIPSSAFRDEGMAARLASFSHADFERRPTAAGTVDARDFFIAFETALPAARTLVTDAGRFWTEAVRILTVQEPSAYVHTGNIASIGLGVGNAIGASYGSTSGPTVLVIGDGGFMMSGLNELSTAVRYKRDVIVAVMNDSSYGAEHIQFRSRQMDPSLTLFEWPSFADVAIAMGAQAATIKGADDLARLETLVSGRKGPLLLDVRLDPEVMPTPVRY